MVPPEGTFGRPLDGSAGRVKLQRSRISGPTRVPASCMLAGLEMRTYAHQRYYNGANGDDKSEPKSHRLDDEAATL